MREPDIIMDLPIIARGAQILPYTVFLSSKDVWPTGHVPKLGDRYKAKVLLTVSSVESRLDGETMIGLTVVFEEIT
jgi:hypothetical protein